MFSDGLTVRFAVLAKLEPSSVDTITSPTVIAVMYAPRRYPSISDLGRGSRSMTVVAATSDGLSMASSAKPNTTPRSLLIVAHQSKPH